MSGIVGFQPDPAGNVSDGAPRIVPGRACGSCTLCCKVVGVDEIAKPIGVWCPHCDRARGCTIYHDRPAGCRRFYCQWMLADGLGPEWKPERAKFALFKAADGQHVTAFVDPGYPSAWRRAPYYENLKHWAGLGVPDLSRMNLIDVMIGQRCIVILPDRDVELGSLGADDVIQLACKPVETGHMIEVHKVKRAPQTQLPPALETPT